MNRVQFVLSSRGWRNLVERTRTVVSRFGPGPQKMARCFRRYMDVLEARGVRPTFPITALPLRRNRDTVVRELLERGAEMAVHAHTHVDLSDLGADAQKRNLERANRTFREAGVPFTGFRAPYLHWNDDTMRCVGELGYLYSSNQVLLWDVYRDGELSAEQEAALERAASFYRPDRASEHASLPWRREGTVEIPVSLPDDEIPVDRLGLRGGPLIATAWARIYDRVLERGELFTLQLHPERIFLCEEGLISVLDKARGDGAWIATLEEIARWWKAKADVRFVLEETPDGGTSVRLAGPEGIVLLERPKRGARWRRAGGPLHLAPREPLPRVGVAPGSSSQAVALLGEDGFWVEETPDGQTCGLHLGRIPSLGRAEARSLALRIEREGGRLVRAARWPRAAPAAVSVTGDIDCLTLWDFALRFVGR
jgi:peptidoglycan/xylan/chitin deacetylase (PgdA/CDA1 family)